MKFKNKIKYGLINILFISEMFYSGLCFSLNNNAVKDEPVTTQQTAHFLVTYQSRTQPLPLNQIHNWVLHVDTLDGNAVEKARISVYGGMPAHKHGLPTQPAVSELGNGDYLVEGIKFSMHGGWEMWFNIRQGNITDKVKFEINF